MGTVRRIHAAYHIPSNCSSPENILYFHFIITIQNTRIPMCQKYVFILRCKSRKWQPVSGGRWPLRPTPNGHWQFRPRLK